MKIGHNIFVLRKHKGLTQEQLANALGISSAAVSKWENDASYPDITLLCPLARALDTSIDHLLQFEESLSEQQIAAQIDQISCQAYQKDGLPLAEQALLALLHTYPSSMVLKYEAALLLHGLAILLPDWDSQKQKLNAWNKELLHEISRSAQPSLSQTATYLLASQALDEDRLEEAEAHLKKLPEAVLDLTDLWAKLWQKRGEKTQAKAAIQSELYNLVQRTANYLARLAETNLEPDPKLALQICQVHRAIETAFSLPSLLSDQLFADAYLRMEEPQKALDCISCVAERANTPEQLSTNPLFSALGEELHDEQQSRRETCRLLTHKLLTDSRYAVLREYEQFQAAINRLESWD